MSDQITYDDKADLIVDTTIDNIFKVTASDMNEIKNVVNGNAEEVGDITSLTTTDKTSVVNAINELNAPEKWVSVGATAPTDGTRVWFAKGKNLFDGQLELGMYDETGAKATNNANYRNVAPINVQPSTTYTFSINGTSQKYVIYLYKKDGTFIRVNTLTSGTFTTPAEAYLLNFRCFNIDFTSDYANLKIQLEQGSTATAYEPYIEKIIEIDNEKFIGQDNLVSVGANQPGDGKRVWFKKSKNKLKLDNVSGTKNGVTYNWEGNKLTLNGTTTASTDIYNFGFWNATTQDANRFLTAGTYTLSIQGASNVGKFSITLYYGTTQIISLFRDNTSVTKTFDSGTYYSNCYISILSNQTFNNDVFYIQIEERK